MRSCDAKLGCGHICPNKAGIISQKLFNSLRFFLSATRMIRNTSPPFALDHAPDPAFEVISAKGYAVKNVESATVPFVWWSCNVGISRIQSTGVYYSPFCIEERRLTDNEAGR